MYFYLEGLVYIPTTNCAYLASKHGVVAFTKAYAKVRTVKVRQYILITLNHYISIVCM